jgi:hypothetical protein
MRGIVLVTALAGFALVSDAASAGDKVVTNIYMNTNSWPEEARGELGDARSSSDGSEYIGCQVAAYTGGTAVAVCYARQNYVYRSCTTYDAGLVARARTVGPASYVDFKWDPSGTCTYLYVSVASYQTPMTP